MRCLWVSDLKAGIKAGIIQHNTIFIFILHEVTTSMLLMIDN